MAVAEVISAIGEVGVVVLDQGARRALDKKINELSRTQEKELSDKLLTTQSNNERLRIVNEYLLKIKNQGASNKIAITRNIGFIVLGLGVISLAMVLIIYRKK